MTFSGMALRSLPLLIIGSCAFAATVTAGQANVSGPNAAVDLPLTLAPASGEQVAAIQADLLFDSTALLFVNATAGASAVTAGKEVSSSSLSDGVVRILVVGVNQNVIPQGVVAHVHFTTAAVIVAGSHAVTFSSILASDPLGTAVPVTGVSGAVLVSKNGFSVHPLGAQKYVGDSYTFSVVPEPGAGTVVYQWKWRNSGGIVQNGATTQTWTLSNLKAANAGAYWCVATFNAKAHTSDEAQLEIKDHLLITAAPIGGTVAAGMGHFFTVQTSGGYSPLSYEWRREGVKIPAAPDAATYPLWFAFPTDAGRYSVVVSDANVDVQVSADSDDAELLVTGTLPVAGLLSMAGLACLLVAMGIRKSQRT